MILFRVLINKVRIHELLQDNPEVLIQKLVTLQSTSLRA
jgi:hypothetical protein